MQYLVEKIAEKILESINKDGFEEFSDIDDGGGYKEVLGFKRT
jgi:hypothetical protein